MVRDIGMSERANCFESNSNRFFNDVELKSTQKQAIAAKQNVHTLTVNRTDQTDAGMSTIILHLHILLYPCHVGVYKAIADNGTGKPVETTCTLSVGSTS